MLKDEKYGGYEIKFIERNGRVWARAPEITTQFIGVGATKAEALNDAKDSIDHFSKLDIKAEKDDAYEFSYELLDKDSAVTEFRKDKKILRIYVDEDPDSPREWDNIGTMVCFHNKYDLPNELNLKSDDFGGWDELRKYLVKEEHAVVIAPLFLYDHSGLRIKIGSFQGHLPAGHAEFDSGQVGFIFVSEEKLKSEKLNKLKANEILKGEVEVYDDYISGNVYGYRLFEFKRGKWEETDSAWGFYGGNDIKENGIQDSVGLGGNWKEV